MGAHRVISLVREVPDLLLTRAFYTEFGLRGDVARQVRHRGGGRAARLACR